MTDTFSILISYSLSQMNQLREAEVKATIAEKEIEMERLVAQRLRQQLQDLQELLAAREKNHQ